ncbi:hypothetical protein LFT48_11855 [Arthrobacter sp. FW305-123]|nr:hypothetical protein LFT48_11855 [Arthrobacter sp. FW305-123]
MTNTGIFTQSAASVLQDVEEFYFGGALPWYHGSKLTEDGLHVSITLDDPESDDVRVRTARIGLRPRP